MYSIFKTSVLCLMIIANTHFAYAQTASILPPAKTTFVDANGKPLVNGKVDFYIPGTTTRKTTWQDSGETIPNLNPVILDAAGRALILGDGSYRQIVRDKNNNVIWDAVTSSTGTSSGGLTATVGDGDLVGTIKPWAGMTAPTQYAFAYGQEFTRLGFPLLFATLTTQQNASCTSGVAALTGLSDTTNIPIGAHVESSCLAAGATVLTKTVSTVTTSSNAIITTTTTARFFPFGNGDGSLTFNAPDLRGKTVAGRCNMGGVACSNLTSTYFGVDPSALSTGGTESKTLSKVNLPSYALDLSGASTQVNGRINNTLSNTPGTVAAVDIIQIAGGGGTTGATFPLQGTIPLGGSSTPVSAIQPTQLLNYIIKTLPDTNANSFFGVASIGGMTGVITCGFGITCAGNSITAVASTVPAPTPTTLGGVFSKTCSSSNWFNSLDSLGNFGCTQPNFTDLAGSIAIGQIPNSLITYAKIQNGTGLSLIGVAGNVAAANADIVAASDNQIMRRSGANIAFGSIDLSQSNSVGSSLLPLANGGLNANNTANNGGIFWSNATQGQILAGIATARLPLLSGATATPVWGAFTLPATAVSGGVLCFTSTTVSASSVLQTANAIMLGGGAGVCPSPLASLGTTTTLLHGNAAGAPTFGAVVSADMNITTTSCTNQFITAISAGGVGTCTTDTLASAQHANQGTTTTVLHGNAAGNPSFAAVSLTADVTGITPIANGGTSQATALAARASSGLNIDGATSTGDANYTILSTDRMVYHTALSAARTDTLPAANSVNAGQTFYITDFRGVVTASNTVTLQRAGADTINGGTTLVAINAQYGAGIYWSDGVSRWTFQPTSSGGGGGTVTQVVCDGVTISTSGTCPPKFGFANCSIAASVAANNLTVALKDNTGADPSASSPCNVWFRSSTLTTGSWVQRTVTSATSFVANASSTFGITNTSAQCRAAATCAFKLHVTLIDTGATAVLGVVALTNATGVLPLDETGVVTTTACSACSTATALGTMYSTAAQTSKAFAYLGYLEWGSGLATAGTYASGPTKIQTMGNGVRKPGEIFNARAGSNTTLATNATTTYAASNTTLSTTITSAANLIVIDWQGCVRSDNPAASDVIVQMFNGGATAIGPIGFANVIGNNIPVFFMIDTPNSTSSQTYTIYFKNNDAATTVRFSPGSSCSGSIKLSEMAG